MSKVYIGMTLDILHHGHANIINVARGYGEVTVGLLTDKAIANHKRLPYLKYEHRKILLENIKGVARIVPQEEWDYSPNLLRYKPDIMVHGDDWLSGPLLPFRKLALKALQSYGGKLVEVPYTEGVSSTDIQREMQKMGTTPDLRRGMLKRLLASKTLCRVIETHSPMSGLVAQSAKAWRVNSQVEFDAFWSSSLTDSSSRGKPDIEVLDLTARLSNINDIFDVTTKPMIMDLDTGGKPEHFEINIKSIERLGISAVIIEDKVGLKKNSLFGTEVFQAQEDPDAFAAKIRAGRAARRSEDFMVIARIESLILDKGMSDAASRAQKYVEAGVDGIMIHSRKKEPDEIFKFAKIFRTEFPFVPMVVVPTSFNAATEEDLAAGGFNIVIYANHLFRAAYPAMMKVATKILEDGRSSGVDSDLMSINDILNLIPGTR
ncbi:phosphoenolpyruvate mutase [Pseudolabrys sp.]|uniref:phosphoenolpyruvate mutase n=1 Tax=Pseudolabrys sp. TaxID=1960880 RepID=UPI003D0B757E